MSRRTATEHGGTGAIGRGPAASLDPGPAAVPRGWRPGWWARFIAWMLALSGPAWFLADAYHSGLRAVTSFTLGFQLPPRSPEEIEVSAVHVLAAYAAMCLASLRSSRARRLVAIAVGLPLLFALEALTGILMIRSEMMAGTGGLPAWLLRFRDQALFAPPWLAAPLMWLLIIGMRELPRLRELGAGEPSADR